MAGWGGVGSPRSSATFSFSPTPWLMGERVASSPPLRRLAVETSADFARAVTGSRLLASSSSVTLNRRSENVSAVPALYRFLDRVPGEGGEGGDREPIDRL